MRNGKLAKLRYNIWFYFIIFAIILVAIIWIFQILLFDNLYQRKKFETLNSYGDSLSRQLNNSNYDDPNMINNWLKTAVEANEAGIFSYLVYYDDNGIMNVETIYSSFTNDMATVDSVLGDFSLQASQSSAESTTIDSEIIDDKIVILDSIARLSSDLDSVYVSYRYNETGIGKYVYASRINNSLISNGFLVLTTSQQAMIEAINVIQIQLVIITVSVILVSFFISWIIATRIARPIIDMSSTAKKWAKGDENVVFKGDSCLELNELANALNYAKEGISQTGLLQRDLMANVSHDLKTPLTMIKAYAEMIRDLSGDIKQKRDLHTQVIIDESDRLTLLVNDILDLSRLQNKMTQLEIKRVDLSELCERVLHRFNDFMARSGYIIEKQIEPNLFADIDEKKMEQVLYNLIGNSLNYTGKDKTIFVKLAKEGDTILFESIDTGKGISEENIRTIWEKYYRFSETHQRPIKGTGLGLSIVKTILESHMLKFGVISKKDVGSNFFIQFKESNVE